VLVAAGPVAIDGAREEAGMVIEGCFFGAMVALGLEGFVPGLAALTCRIFTLTLRDAVPIAAVRMAVRTGEVRT
jgi:hypothetical protein